jgi:cation transport ATPase
MDTLVPLGVATATVWSLYTVFRDDAARSGSAWGPLLQPAGSVYLDVAAWVTVFVLADGCSRPARGVPRATRCGPWPRSGAKQATLLREDGTEDRVPATAVRVGNRLVVRPGGSRFRVLTIR